MRTPPPLQRGDTIGIVSPSGIIDSVLIDQAVDCIESAGFKCIVGENAKNKHHLYAGQDDERLADLQHMLDDSSVRAILCSRGGYGALRILTMLNLAEYLTNYKWLIGFSDITALHSMSSMLGIKSLHAPMVKDIAKTPERQDVQQLFSILQGTLPCYEVAGHPLNIEGEASAVLVGGNLSMLYSLRGTPYDLSTKGRILFFEDINEYLYHLDRLLTNLRMGGKFNAIKGVIVGGLTDMKDGNHSFGKTAEEIILEHLRPFNIPVLLNFPAGHTDLNLPLILGNKIKLQCSKEGGKVQFS